MSQSSRFILGFLFFTLMPLHTLCAQSFNLDQTLSKVYITGTSSLHDWWVDANSLNGEVDFVLNSDNNIVINKLTLSVAVSGLKGEKDGMNKNIQKALVADSIKTIDYLFKSITKCTPINNNSFQLETLGLLTISGTSRQITLNLDVEILKNRIHIKGNRNLKMSDFNISPPKALLGMIKTGDAIMVKFDMVYQ